ncbi:retrovirus-related pol polyprotein from transposon TNT 1-94 [Tanacetum coccineum]|uniref:Retrovirus-related pol polyprotein from transposon TNT 1-94 n=1 Tax=Tanacetum coccineum TaxID=301880 RepID=A0ABQ5FG52_9ASTR
MLSHGGHSIFQKLKEHFEGIQKDLTKKIKEMKDIFEELEAEVDQNVVKRKHDEIKQKNLLTAHDTLIADCLSKEVFYVATNSELNVSRFTEMHDAHTILEARCLELKAELSKLRDKIKKDDHNELVNRFSNIEITRTKHIEKTTALLTKNENLKVQIHNEMQCVTTNPVKPRVIALGKYAIDVEPIPPRNRNNREVHLDYLKHLKESVETIREIVKEAKVKRPLDRSLASACCYTKHSQELLEYAIGTCLKDFNQRDKKHAHTPLIRKKQCDLQGILCGRTGHNLFSIRQFYDSDLEVAFRKHSCFVQDTVGVELIKGSRGSNFYTISVEDMMKSSPICLLSKASKNKSWLWHRHLNHLNFSTINDLARKDLVRGLPRLKFEKDHLCSACQLRKSKKHTHKPKTENTNLEVFYTLYMDLCGPMSVLTDSEVQVKMEMEIPHSSGDLFLTACSYSTYTSKDLMKAQVYVSKLPQL